MAVLTDYGVKDGTLIGNPSSGNYYRFMDSNNSYALTIRDDTGTDEVYTTGVIPEAYAYRVLVNQDNLTTTLGGTIDSTVQYFIDGILDFTGVNIEVPATGVFITGYNSEVSQMVCADNSYTMFTSPGVGGSGSILMKDLAIEVSGTSSQVFDLVGNTGFEALETSGVNYNNCTSRGEIDTYRQGLDENLGIFGGQPSLTLSGTWLGGYRVTSAIVRSLDDAWAGSLFTEGTSFVMNSRFLTDANVDLGTLSSFMDFRPANFPNSGTLQIKDAIFSRNGTIDPTDSNIFPNISATDLASVFRKNQGTENTFIGARSDLTTEIITVITGAGTYTSLLGSWTASDLQHFDAPSNGQLRNLGTTPFQFKVFAFFEIDGGANDDVSIRFRRFNASDSTTDTVFEQTFRIENNVGGNDVGRLIVRFNVSLFENDYIFPQITNITDTTSLTAQDTSYIIVEER